ncbi:hypothetical protein HZH68_007364 [Vespula germanica]|uniref:Uncharacterized protein n=1 Tax=Vespula germanica TaxID=30212 RepID=A0A834K6S4_VESGE|nr:hypothetical protein HZH68_007364 [Vespula germanica]
MKRVKNSNELKQSFEVEDYANYSGKGNYEENKAEIITIKNKENFKIVKILIAKIRTPKSKETMNNKVIAKNTILLYFLTLMRISSITILYRTFENWIISTEYENYLTHKVTSPGITFPGC